MSVGNLGKCFGAIALGRASFRVSLRPLLLPFPLCTLVMFALSARSTLALSHGRQVCSRTESTSAIFLTIFFLQLPLSFKPGKQQVRNMNMHEYQSKALMDKYGVNTQKYNLSCSGKFFSNNFDFCFRWRLATNGAQAATAVKELGMPRFRRIKTVTPYSLKKI